MILQFKDIENILDNKPNAQLVKFQQDYNKEMRIHFYGDKMDEKLETIEMFEKPTLRKLRVKYASSNKDLFERLSRPIDKVFTARGGSIYYNLPESQERVVRQLSMDIGGGVSLKKWLENNWKPHYLDDPGGIILMEIKPKQEAALLKQQNKSFVYPTYKSSQNIVDYSFTGSQFDYLVLNVDGKDKKTFGIDDKDGLYYRVIDDSQDMLVKYENSEITIVDVLPNFFQKVPAILCSDIVNTKDNFGVIGLFDSIVEKANEYLLKGSIKITHDFLHGFPKYWEYADDCDKCGGTGLIGAENCVACKGSGKRIMNKVSDVKLLEYPQDKETPIVTPNVAGYVEPSETYYNIAVNDLSILEDYMTFTIWGKESQIKTQGLVRSATQQPPLTATQVVTELKPEADRLQAISSYAEKVHKFCLDMLIVVQVANNYNGSSVNYGNRYILESPDDLWEKYLEAKTSGATDVALDAMLYDYYEAAYFNDPVEQAIKIKLMKVEPNIHLSITQVKALGYDEQYLKRKMYFGDWKRSLSQSELIINSVQQLQDSLTNFITPISLPQPEPQKQLVA